MTCTIESAVEQCLQIIAFGVDHRKRDDPRTAGRAFAAALLAARELTEQESRDLRSLALYNVSLLQRGLGHRVEAQQLSQQASTFLSENAGFALPPFLLPLFQELMADVLTSLGEYRRAIPFCEASIENLMDLVDDPVSTAEALWRAGKCYVRTGLRDHAAIPLRAAVKIFRTLAGDPRLPAVLLDLGSALRKSNPVEAERCYCEAADFHVERAQMESAAPAWVNLGVLCNEQGRYAEALAHYQKALRLREQITGIPPERIGGLLNNIANVRRKMGQFAEAHLSVDRAFEFLEPAAGYSMACAYGTKGLIFRDQGRDEEAVAWFRKSSAEHEKQPSPNLATLSEELENEAAALDRLGRLEEALEARSKLESVRAAINGIGAVDRELADPKPPAEGAVLIELDFGIRIRGLYGKGDPAHLLHQLSDVLEQQANGFYGGRVTIPETTTLMFYGDDAEEMFRAMEPILVHEPMCGGAKVTVRQGVWRREVHIRGRVM